MISDVFKRQLEEFKRERDEMLLSLDLDKARAYSKKWGAHFPDDESVALAGLHKARTAATTLPIEARRLSKRWLLERGMESLDDGDL